MKINLKERIKTPSGIGALVLLVGICLHYHWVLWVLRSPLKLFSVFAGPLGEYALVFVIGLMARTAPPVVGGALGILIAMLVYRFVSIPLLGSIDTPFWLVFPTYPIVFAGVVFGFCWSKLFRYQPQVSPAMDNAAPADSTSHNPAAISEQAQSSTLPRSTARVLGGVGLCFAFLPLLSPLRGIDISPVLFLPWYYFARKWRSVTAVMAGGLILMAGVLLVIMSAYFSHVTASTASILAYSFSMVTMVVVVLPVSVAVGYIVNAVMSLLPWRPSDATRVRAALGGAALLLALLFVSRGRIQKLTDVRAKVGEPGIRLNTAGLVSQKMSFDGESFGEFTLSDGTNGVLVSNPSLTLLDTSDFHELRHWDNMWAAADKKPVWLAKGGTMAVVDQYQATLTGAHDAALWKFKYGGDNPLVKMAAADLDGDGETEFYAATTGGLYRLDETGRMVWVEREYTENAVFPMPASGGQPARVMDCYNMGCSIWSPEGKKLGTIRPPSSLTNFNVVNFGEEYLLVAAKSGNPYSKFVVMNISGKVLWEGETVAELNMERAVAVRFAPDEEPYLAVESRYPTNRYGLDVFSSDGKPVYRAVFAGEGYRALLSSFTDHKTGLGYLVLGNNRYYPERLKH